MITLIACAVLAAMAVLLVLMTVGSMVAEKYEQYPDLVSTDYVKNRDHYTDDDKETK